MTRADLRPPRKIRIGTVLAVLALHGVLIVFLIRAFTPDFATSVVKGVERVLAVDIRETPPSPEPAPSAAAEKAPPKEEGAAAPPGKKADPREVSAPKARVVIKPTQAPPVSGKGRENASGAKDEGEGTGAAGTGNGTGSGASGSGQGGGGGGGSPTVKIAGEINSAKDYPRKTRELRIGHSVIVDLTVGIDGRVVSCRVSQPSPDMEADRITCELATKRFRFRPATDASGEPRVAVYRWRQRWFY